MPVRSRSLDVLRGLAVATPLAIAGWGAMTLPAVAAHPAVAGGPAGNNGTVKITPQGEDDGIPQNTPHVPCAFDVEWYGFDEGADVVSTVTFSAQAPTSGASISVTGPSQVFVGGDPAGGAGNDPDGEATYTLVLAGEPNPQQGYHVKVTVETPGAHGAGTKQKVFWVTGPCDEPPGTNT
jgi:hypothetical protein